MHLKLTPHCKSTILQFKIIKEFHSPWAPMAEDNDKNDAADTHVPGVHSDAPSLLNPRKCPGCTPGDVKHPWPTSVLHSTDQHPGN